MDGIFQCCLVLVWLVVHVYVYQSVRVLVGSQQPEKKWLASLKHLLREIGLNTSFLAGVYEEQCLYFIIKVILFPSALLITVQSREYCLKSVIKPK